MTNSTESVTGQGIFLNAANSVVLGLPTGYISGSALSGQVSFLGTTIATIGATPGTYTWSWGSGDTADTLVLQVGPAPTAAPEPSTMISAATGVLMLAGYTWRKRRTDRPAAA